MRDCEEIESEMTMIKNFSISPDNTAADDPQNSTMTKLSPLLPSSLSYCMVLSGPIFGGGKMNVNYVKVKEQHKSTSH